MSGPDAAAPTECRSAPASQAALGIAGHGYSVEQTARLVSALRWACERLAQIAAAWAAEAAADAASLGDAPSSAADSEIAARAAVRLARLGRRFDAHAAALDGHQPDSQRLGHYRQASPEGPPVKRTLDEVAALTGHWPRLVVAERVLAPRLLAVYTAISEHAAAHCDGALSAAAHLLRRDLEQSLRAQDGSDGPAVPADDADPPVANARPASSDPIAEAVAAAQHLLEAVGGIISSSVLKPASFQ